MLPVLWILFLACSSHAFQAVKTTERFASLTNTYKGKVAREQSSEISADGEQILYGQYNTSDISKPSHLPSSSSGRPPVPKRDAGSSLTAARKLALAETPSLHRETAASWGSRGAPLVSKERSLASMTATLDELNSDLLAKHGKPPSSHVSGRSSSRPAEANSTRGGQARAGAAPPHSLSRGPSMGGGDSRSSGVMRSPSIGPSGSDEFTRSPSMRPSGSGPPVKKPKSLENIIAEMKPILKVVLDRGFVSINAQGQVSLTKLKDGNTIPFIENEPQALPVPAEGTEAEKTYDPTSIEHYKDKMFSAVEVKARDVVQKTLEDLNVLLAIVGVDTISLEGFSSMEKDHPNKPRLIDRRNNWVQRMLSPALVNEEAGLPLIAFRQVDKTRGRLDEVRYLACKISVKTLFNMELLLDMRGVTIHPRQREAPYEKLLQLVKERMLQAEQTVERVKEIMDNSRDYLEFTEVGGRLNVELPIIESEIKFAKIGGSGEGTPSKVRSKILDLIKDDGTMFQQVQTDDRHKINVMTSLVRLSSVLQLTGVYDMTITGQTLHPREDGKYVEGKKNLKALIVMARATNVVQMLISLPKKANPTARSLRFQDEGSKLVENFREWCKKFLGDGRDATVGFREVAKEGDMYEYIQRYSDQATEDVGVTVQFFDTYSTDDITNSLRKELADLSEKFGHTCVTLLKHQATRCRHRFIKDRFLFFHLLARCFIRATADRFGAGMCDALTLRR